MRKVATGILDLGELKVSGSVRDIALQAALGEVGIKREVVESELYDAKSHKKDLRQTKVDIPRLDVDKEFGASGPELGKYYVGRTGSLARKLKKLIEVDPNKTDKTSLNFKIDIEEFSLALRMKGPQRIWAFNRKDLARLASALNLQLKNTNRPTEISLLDCNVECGASRSELQKYYVGNPDKLALKINKLIGVDPEKTDKTSLNFKINGEEFSVALRMNGPKRIWAFDRKDLPRLESALNMQLKGINVSLLNSNTEFGASGNELQKYYVGHPNTLAHKLNKLIGVAPEKTGNPSRIFVIDGEEFCVALRMNACRRIWSFDKKDLPRLASALNLQLKDTNISLLDCNTEFGASVPELKKYYVGEPDEIVRKLNKLIYKVRGATGKTALNIKIENETFSVVLRLNATRRIWSFGKKDLPRLASALNLQLKDTNISLLDSKTEFSASGTELQKYFVGDANKLALKLKKLIVVVRDNTDKTSLNLDIGGEEFSVALRMNVCRRIWSFKKVDLPRLAKAMNWQLKPQKRPNSGLSRLVQRMTFSSTLQIGTAMGEA